MLKRISAALAAGRQAVATTSAASEGGGSENPPKLAWALVHFGDAQTLVPRLARHRAFCLQRGFKCLLIADDIPDLCVVSREVSFEFVPWPGTAAMVIPGGHAAAVDHSFQRLGQLMAFWKVVGCEWEGGRAEVLLEMAPSWAHPVILAARNGRTTASLVP